MEVAPDVISRVEQLEWQHLLPALGGMGIKGLWGQPVDVFRQRSTGTIIMGCVFHDERTPSMILWPSGNYKCHGCGQAGNKATFIGALLTGDKTVKASSVAETSIDLEWAVEAAEISQTLHPDQLMLDL